MKIVVFTLSGLVLLNCCLSTAARGDQPKTGTPATTEPSEQSKSDAAALKATHRPQTPRTIAAEIPKWIRAGEPGSAMYLLRKTRPVPADNDPGVSALNTILWAAPKTFVAAYQQLLARGPAKLRTTVPPIRFDSSDPPDPAQVAALLKEAKAWAALHVSYTEDRGYRMLSLRLFRSWTTEPQDVLASVVVGPATGRRPAAAEPQAERSAP